MNSKHTRTKAQQEQFERFHWLGRISGCIQTVRQTPDKFFVKEKAKENFLLNLEILYTNIKTYAR